MRTTENSAGVSECGESRIRELMTLRHIILGEVGQYRSEVQAGHSVWMRAGDMFRTLRFGNANMAFTI